MDLVFMGFVAISLIAGLIAAFMWIRVYNHTQRGSIAWLLLALTAVFLITTSVFPAITIRYYGVEEVMIVFLAFWSAVYTSTFAGAGFLIDRAFKTVPREQIGEFLVEGMVFDRPPTVPSACGINCFMCELHLSNECSGCFDENDKADTKCPVYACTRDRDIESCWSCDDRDGCDKLRESIEKSPLKGVLRSVPEVDEVSRLLGRSTLIEYTPESRYEDAVIETTLRIFGECRNVVLVSNEPRISEYRDRLHDLIDIGAMKFIDISSTARDISESDGVVTLPLNRTEQFSDLFDHVPEGIWIIFEPVSHLIFEQGVDKAYDILSKSIELFSHKQFNVVALINKEAHEDDVVRRFEGLFLDHALLTADKIRVIKGGGEEYIRLMVGDHFFIHGDAHSTDY